MFKKVTGIFNNAKKKVTDWIDSHPVEVAVIELVGMGAAVGGTAGLLIGKHSGYKKGYDTRCKELCIEQIDLYGFEDPKANYSFDMIKCRNTSVDDLLAEIGTIEKTETLSGMLVKDSTVSQIFNF